MATPALWWRPSPCPAAGPAQRTSQPAVITAAMTVKYPRSGRAASQVPATTTRSAASASRIQVQSIGGVSIPTASVRTIWGRRLRARLRPRPPRGWWPAGHVGRDGDWGAAGGAWSSPSGHPVGLSWGAKAAVDGGAVGLLAGIANEVEAHAVGAWASPRPTSSDVRSVDAMCFMNADSSARVWRAAGGGVSGPPGAGPAGPGRTASRRRRRGGHTAFPSPGSAR